MSGYLKSVKRIIFEANVSDFVLEISELLKKHPDAKFNVKSAGIVEKEGAMYLTCTFRYKFKDD